MKTLELKSGRSMPALGFGTWQITGQACTDAVQAALDIGYTHIDTAMSYGNQREIGRAISESGADRRSLFITSKIWVDSLRHDAVLRQTDTILEELRTDYLDLLLIHWPVANVPLSETLPAFAELYEAGKVRSIGISNFNTRLVEEATAASPLPVSVNQVEYHPLLNQEKLLSHCRERGIVLTAYSPLAHGRVFRHPLLREIGERYGKNPGQIALRWLLQKGLAVIPRSSNRDHIASNFQVLDFDLSGEEMARIDTIQESKRVISGDWIGADLES